MTIHVTHSRHRSPPLKMDSSEIAVATELAASRCRFVCLILLLLGMLCLSLVTPNSAVVIQFYHFHEVFVVKRVLI